MKKGFTLLEVVLAIGAVSLLTLAVVGFVFSISNFKAKSQAVREVGEQGRLAMLILERIVKSAETVILPASGSSGTTLSLDVLEVAQDPTVFSVSSGVLYITEGVNPPVALTNSRVFVDALNFTNLAPAGAPGSIKIDLTMSYFAPDNSQFEYTESFYTAATTRAR